jgi:hypothetical protein
MPAPGNGSVSVGNWRANSAVGIIERVNRFFEWIGLKEKLHRLGDLAPREVIVVRSR